MIIRTATCIVSVLLFILAMFIIVSAYQTARKVERQRYYDRVIEDIRERGSIEERY